MHCSYFKDNHVDFNVDSSSPSNQFLDVFRLVSMRVYHDHKANITAGVPVFDSIASSASCSLGKIVHHDHPSSFLLPSLPSCVTCRVYT